jgi:hypothetical protein
MYSLICCSLSTCRYLFVDIVRINIIVDKVMNYINNSSNKFFFVKEKSLYLMLKEILKYA